MRNVKKVIAGILLTATVLGTGTQLSVGATRYSLEGSPSEVSFNKRPAKVKNKFYTGTNSYSKADSNAKVQEEMKELDHIYNSVECSYYINAYKTYKDDGVTIDVCEEEWNEVANKCNEVLSYYNESDERDEVKKYNLMKQITNATIAWLRAEKEPTVENWNNVALEFEEVKNSMESTKKEISKSLDYTDDLQAQIKVDTAEAYAAFVELNNVTNPTEEDYDRVGSLIANATIKNYDQNIRYDGLAEECNGKFEEIYNKVASMEQEGQNSKLLAEFTLMKNQIRLIQTDKLCEYAESCELEEKCQLINEAERTYSELFDYFVNIKRQEEASKCLEELQKMESDHNYRIGVERNYLKGIGEEEIYKCIERLQKIESGYYDWNN